MALHVLSISQMARRPRGRQAVLALLVAAYVLCSLFVLHTSLFGEHQSEQNAPHSAFHHHRRLQSVQPEAGASEDDEAVAETSSSQPPPGQWRVLVTGAVVIYFMRGG